MEELGYWYLFFSGFFFYLYCVLFTSFSLTLDVVEEIHFYKLKGIKFKILIIAVKYVLLVGFLFASIFWMVYNVEKQSFNNVDDSDFVSTFFDFFFYATTNFLINNSSEIKPTTTFAKFLVLNQNILSFTTIVIFLAQYTEIGNFFKEFQDWVNGKHPASPKKR